MQAIGLTLRSFRNLSDVVLELPDTGVALIGANGHGKTNLLEALAYPVLFRSVRGSPDREVGLFSGAGFMVSVTEFGGTTVAATYYAAQRRKRITIDGEDQPTISAAIGRWLAVGFFPTDLALVQGGAAERRRWLDRMLSLADRAYLEALLRYRGALAQRNAALRGNDLGAADAFNPALAQSGSLLARQRRAWAATAVPLWQGEVATLGESSPVTLRYRGDDALDDAGAWDERLHASRTRDLARGQTHVGPHRDDVVLGLGGHTLRHYGSTGQQRTAAIALRLLELETLATARNVRPALLVDDVFAELDHDRQRRLATRLVSRPGQRFVTAPRSEEIPPELDLPRWDVQHGMIRQVLSAVA